MFSDPNLHPLHFRPERLSYPDAWVGHTPFAAWLVRDIRPRTFVELGTHSGNSYFAFCQAVAESQLATRCFAVDTWAGDEHAGFYDDTIYADVAAYNDTRFASFSRLLRSTFDDAVSYFADGAIDLLHIDGLHTYEAVKHDFETWLPKLAPNAIVVLHDTNVRERGFGVWRFWVELCAEYPQHLEFVHSHGLGVIQLGGGGAPWLARDFPDKTGFIRTFARLGELVRVDYRARGVREAGWRDPQELEIERLNLLVSERQASLVHAEEIRVALVAEIEGHTSRAASWGLLHAEQATLLKACGEENDLLKAEHLEKDRVFAEQNRVHASDKELFAKQLASQAAETIECEREQAVLLAALEETVAAQADQAHELQAALQVRSAQLEELIAAHAQARSAYEARQAYFQHASEQRHEAHARLKSLLDHADAELYTLKLSTLSLYANADSLRGSLVANWVSAARRKAEKPSASTFSPHASVRRKRLRHRREALERALAKTCLFDADFYVNQSGGVGALTQKPIRHFIDHGIFEMRNPNKFFDIRFYLLDNPDVRAAGVHPVLHYANFGWKEGRRPHPSFDPQWYLNFYRDVAEAEIEPLQHYIWHGLKEGRRSSGDALPADISMS
ncbi:MAG: glycosyl transferase family 2 [Hyphomicrobiales bacterium]|nr:glycosyl transferase family 2 [Hyphomicrobiales bacterium]